MSTPPGLLTLPELEELVKQQEIDTVAVVFTDLYGRMVGKRFDARFFLDTVAEGGTHACNYLLTVDMEMEPVPGYALANWESGYGDFHLLPDFTTLRRAAWLEKTALIQCNLQNDVTHAPVREAPRSLLNQQIAKAETAGFNAKAGSELEYYLFDNSYREAHEKNFQNLQPAGWYIEDYHMLQGAREESFNGAVRRYLSQSGVVVESTKGEWGTGQHELNVKYDDILKMADNHAVYKQCLKETADKMGVSVTFMAKFETKWAGSSSHVHLSLWKEGENAFVGTDKFGPIACSDTFRHFLGGWIRYAGEVTPFYAPTVNSYKRFQSGSWAPTRLAWSNDNRTAGFRIVGSGPSLRIECRIPGADCNPYLAFAASLASGLQGIANKIEPPECFSGDMYHASEIPQVPQTLHQATDLFEKSEFVRDAFGEDVQRHYTHFFRTEQATYDREITDWERRRYFERI
ncbi:MAG: glutamine synthetase [Planctomycetaceae bacterium]|nr:glutamine synthetase [Planctomycetaceae bacterium]